MAGRDGRMRAGHADRERVIGVLKAAFVQGRLDARRARRAGGSGVRGADPGELAALRPAYRPRPPRLSLTPGGRRRRAGR